MQSKSFLKKFTSCDGVIYRKKENRLPPALPNELAQEFLLYAYSAYGHPGTFQLMKLATRIVYIPCVKEKCQQVCRQCIICLRSKPQHALRPSAIPRKDYPEAPFLKTAIDLYDLGEGKRWKWKKIQFNVYLPLDIIFRQRPACKQDRRASFRSTNDLDTPPWNHWLNTQR